MYGGPYFLRLSVLWWRACCTRMGSQVCFPREEWPGGTLAILRIGPRPAQARSIDAPEASEEPSAPRERSDRQQTAAWLVLGKRSAPAPGQEREGEMGTIRLEQVLAEVKRLSPEEQQQLRDTLDQWLRHARPEDRLADALVEAGLLRAQRPRGEATVPPMAFTPVAVRGQPVSETLIEERR